MDRIDATPPAGISGGLSTTDKEESPMNLNVKKENKNNSAQGCAKMDGPTPTSRSDLREDERFLSREQVQRSSSHEKSDQRGRSTEEKISSKEMMWY